MKKEGIRYKLLLSVLGITCILWLGIAPWIFFTIKADVQQVLDDRLAASANMLSTIMLQYELGNEDMSKRHGKSLKDFTQNISISDSISCRVSRIDGAVIASSNNAQQTLLASVKDGYSSVEENHVLWRVYQLTQNGLVVTTAEKIDKRNQLFKLILIGLLAPLIFAIVAMLATLYFVIQQIVKPLTQLEKQFATRSGNTLFPIDIHVVPLEIKGVITEFNKLLARVESVIENERRFTADAAHELRTPLAGISVQLQVIALKADEETDQILNKAQLAVKQLSQMLDQLLMLARLDARQLEAVSLLTNATKLTKLALVPLLSYAEQKKVIIKTLNNSDKKLHLPEELVSLALRNVIKNAIQFSTVEQQVSITTFDNEKQVVWLIEDSAGGVAVNMLPRITARFVHDKQKGNSGLGLSITKAIVEILEGNMVFQNTSCGLSVKISFPVNRAK